MQDSRNNKQNHFVFSNWLIEQIASGEVLKVIVNDPEALQNIDSWTKKSGDRILRIENNTKINAASSSC